MQGFIDGLLESKRYRVVRAALLVVACVLIALAISMISSTTEQLSRNQQVAAGVVQTEPRADVLVIASYDDSDAATKLQRDGVVDLLERSSVGVDVEYLDVAALSANKNVSASSAYGAALSGSDWGSALAKKLRDHGEYAAIVCIDDDALYYVESLHDSLFPKTPVVFVGVNDVSHAQHAFELGYATGLMERCDAAGMVEVASKMNPEATHMLVITDNTAAGLGVRAQFEEAASGSDGGAASEESVVFAGLPVDYVNASTLSRADLGTKVSSADDSTLVVYLGAAADASGNAYRAAQTAYYVSQAATQPIYAIGFGGVGEGFTASNFVDYEQAGQRAGEIVVMVLNGTSTSDIPLETFESSGTVFDSRSIASHGISAATVPASATMLNQSGFSFDALRPVVWPLTLLVLGIACIIAFAFLGYRRTAKEMAEVVTQRNTLEQRFYTDDLTSMPNMQWLTAYAGSDGAKRVRSIAEVAFTNLDALEETRGSSVVDEAIKALAKRLGGLEKTFLVRPDHNSFIVGYNSALKRGTGSLADLERVLSQPVVVRGSSIVFDQLIAVFNREHNTSIEEMVAGADLAVHQAEESGKTDKVIFYDKDMRKAEDNKLQITALLSDALANDDLIVLYQPQIEIASNEVVGYEALVRLRGDVYPPEQFIPVAEMNGQIVEIDRQVTRKVVQQLATWKKRKRRMRPISINYSYGKIRDEHFVEYTAELLDEYEVARKLIRIDIKDDLFLNNKDKAADFVEKLQGAGFGIAIDGFGVGYASISRIVKVPADVVKIDRSLTASLLASDEEGLANFVRLAHESNKLVVVEGVETVEQFEKCCELDCDVVQGFLFSRPLLPEKAMQYKPHKFSVPKKRKGDKLPGRSTSLAEDPAANDSAVSDDAADEPSTAPVPSPELETSTPAAADESAPTDDKLPEGDKLPGRSSSPADEPATSDADSTAEALTASPALTDEPSTASGPSPDASVPTSRAAASGEDPAADASAVSGNAANEPSTASASSPDASVPTSRATASGEDPALEHEQETLGEAAESEPEAPSASKMGASSGSDISAGSEPSASASTEPTSESESDAASADAGSVSREGFGPK